ncbi:MAG TPA: tetratricopeptide repeat protein [Anaerolineae bacterium]
MATHDRSRTLDTETNAPDEFERLRRFILYHLGGFTLGLVRVNDPRQRDGVIASLAEALAAAAARLVRVDLANRYPGGLRNALRNDPDARAALQDPARAALALVGLEHLIEAEPDETGRPPFAAALNVERDALHAALPLPIILFLTDHAMDRLDLAAPDFFDWYSGVFRLRPAGAPELTTASRLAEPRQPYETGSLSPGTRQERLDFLEDRRAELAQQAGPEARLRLAQVLKEMGELYAGLPEFHNRQLAVPSLKQAAEIFREEGHKSDEAGALETLGGVCYWIDDYKQSRRRYEAALPLYREIGSRLGEANCIRSLGDVHVQLSEYALARQRYEAALPLYREIGDRLGEANCIQSLGDVHVRLSEYALARQRYEAALPLYREIGSRLGEANTYTAFGDLSLAEEDFTAARERFEQALPIYREIGARLGQTYVALQTARALLGLGEKRQAVEALEQGAALARSIDGQPNLNAILQLLKQAREKE